MRSDDSTSDLPLGERAARDYRLRLDGGEWLESTVLELLRSFGYTEESQLARESVADLLWQERLQTEPSVANPKVASTKRVRIVRVEEEHADQSRKAAETHSDGYKLNPVATAIATIGGLLLVISSFLPLDEPAAPLGRVQSNTLIQRHEWWLPLVGAILLAAALSAHLRGQRPSRAMLLLTVISVGSVIYIGQSKSLRTLFPVNANGEAETSGNGEVVSFGIAIYVAAVGALLTVIGAWLMRHWAEPLSAHAQAATKQCPDCAETVLAEAHVCKHCGYRFEAPPSAKSA